MCRECYWTKKKEDKSSALPLGVRYIMPNFRDDRSLSFRTSDLSLDALIGNYDIVYISIDGDREPFSCSAKGSIDIRAGSNAENLLTGSIKMVHNRLQEKIDTIWSFQVGDDLTFRGNLLNFFHSHVQEFAPNSSWHDPGGDCYSRHGDGFPGKLKIVNNTLGLPLWFSSSRTQRTSRTTRVPRNMNGILKRYEDTSNYWICHHFGLSEDVGRLIRKFVCPIPILSLLPGDLFLVAGMQSKWQVCFEVTLVARKVLG